jgi:voltage-gated potassium channel
MTRGTNPADSPTYHIVMLVLCLYALGSLAAQGAIAMDPEGRAILYYADYAVCLFFLNFLALLWRAPNRMKYLVAWAWLDLLSSIPTLDVGRWGRMGRIVRILRALRELRAAKPVTSVVLRHRAQTTFLAASFGGSPADRRLQQHRRSAVRKRTGSKHRDSRKCDLVGLRDDYDRRVR